jgi:hypothetical protein
MANRWACRLALVDTNLGRPLNMAGKQALERFLEDMGKEERRK